MKRFWSWCRRPYLRIYFSEPPIHRVAEDAMKAVHNVLETAQEAVSRYTDAVQQIEKLHSELRAYFCASLEEDSQIAELNRIRGSEDA